MVIKEGEVGGNMGLAGPQICDWETYELKTFILTPYISYFFPDTNSSERWLTL